MTWLAILTNRWAQLAAGAALALVLGFGLGHHQKTLEDASKALKSAKATIQAVKAQSAAISVIDQHTTQAVTAIQQHTITLIQKVPIYVTRKADDQCIVSAGAVRLLDAAGGSSVPSAPSGISSADPGLADPDADSGVKLSAVVQADVVNAGNYRQLSEWLKEWNDWYDAQKKIAESR